MSRCAPLWAQQRSEQRKNKKKNLLPLDRHTSHEIVQKNFMVSVPLCIGTLEASHLSSEWASEVEATSDPATFAGLRESSSGGDAVFVSLDYCGLIPSCLAGLGGSKGSCLFEHGICKSIASIRFMTQDGRTLSKLIRKHLHFILRNGSGCLSELMSTNRLLTRLRRREPC